MKTKCANASGFPNEAISIKSHMTTLLGENRDKKSPVKVFQRKQNLFRFQFVSPLNSQQ